jgi:hypothetical protein
MSFSTRIARRRVQAVSLTLEEYYDLLDWDHLPVKRGIALTQHAR